MSDDEIKLEARVALLQLFRLFRNMPKLDHEAIASCAVGVVYARDERLFAQGQTFRSLVLLRSGSVKITQLSSDGSEVILRMHGTGSVVGMLSGLPVDQNSCHAVEKSTALVWSPTTL